jgi:hypothetical protein
LTPGAPDSEVKFVKVFALAIARLCHREIAGFRLAGLADANPERRALVHGLIEDHRHSLDPDTVTRVLPGGDFEIAVATVGCASVPQ